MLARPPAALRSVTSTRDSVAAKTTWRASAVTGVSPHAHTHTHTPAGVRPVELTCCSGVSWATSTWTLRTLWAAPPASASIIRPCARALTVSVFTPSPLHSSEVPEPSERTHTAGLRAPMCVCVCVFQTMNAGLLSSVMVPVLQCSGLPVNKKCSSPLRTTFPCTSLLQVHTHTHTHKH